MYENVFALQFRSKAFWINKCIFIYFMGPLHIPTLEILFKPLSLLPALLFRKKYIEILEGSMSLVVVCPLRCPATQNLSCPCSEPEPQLPSDQEPQLPGDLDLQLPGTIFHAEPNPELDPDPQCAARLTPSPWPAWTLSPLFLLSAWSPVGGAQLGLYAHQLAYFWSSISHSHSCFQSPGQCLKLL